MKNLIEHIEPLLQADGFDDATRKKFYESLRKGIDKFNLEQKEEQAKQQAQEAEKQAEKSAQNTAALMKIVNKILENPAKLKSVFHAPWYKAVFRFGIELSVIVALVLLAWKGVLGTCETSTILGGIVGYILGTER